MERKERKVGLALNLMINDLKVKDMRRALKEKILGNLFLVKLRNLELRSTRDMFNEELANFKSNLAGRIDANSEQRESLIRMCLHYENTFNIVSSILDNSAEITNEILVHAYNAELESRSPEGRAAESSSSSFSSKVQELDPNLAGFLDRFALAIKQRCIEDEKISLNIEGIIALVDLLDSDYLPQSSLALVQRIQDEMQEVYQLIQDYLSYTDKHFASMIQ